MARMHITVGEADYFPDIQFESDGLDGYRVYVMRPERREDEYIGTVEKWERRYNLRRVLVSRGWRATTPDGTRLFTSGGYTGELRKDAAAALFRHARGGDHD